MSWQYADPLMVKLLRNETVELEIRQTNIDKVVRCFIKQVNEKYGTHYMIIKDDESPHERAEDYER